MKTVKLPVGKGHRRKGERRDRVEEMSRRWSEGLDIWSGDESAQVVEVKGQVEKETKGRKAGTRTGGAT